MAEVGFYHLTRSSAEPALPRLLERTLELGKRALVRVRDQARAAALDEALWKLPEPVWLPHGNAALGDAEMQPVLIAGEPGPAAAPNRASFLFLLDGVQAAAEPFERVFDLFDGADAAAVAAARGRWSALKQSGHRLTYWQQDATGWHKAG